MLRWRSLGSLLEACYSNPAPLAPLARRPAHQRFPRIQPKLTLRAGSTSCPSMRDIESDTPYPGRVRKRRRISTPQESSNKAMHPVPTISLTPIERTLRTLLLDVAQYIREQEIVEGGSDVVSHPETVLRFTGGWVRDKLLGVDSHDIDVGISSMTGYQFGMALKQYLDSPQNLAKYKKGLPNGEMNDAIVSLHKIEANPEKSKHLETVTTRIFGLDIDLVNLRKETYSEDSRNPQMEFGTAVEDAMRRDATINALFYNLNDSRLEDLTEHGLDDMKNKLIRTPLEPYQTFKDDPLRVLRLIRFASRLGYQIDPETMAAMQNADISEALKLKISKERVGTELEKMLRGPDPHGALRFIDQLGLYSTILANHQDEVTADTSTWSLAYNALAKLLRPYAAGSPEIQGAVECICQNLVLDESSTYSAWVVATFAPWLSVSARTPKGPKAKPLPQRAVEVARDSLRSDNKTLSILRDAASNYQDIIEVKTSLVNNTMQGTSAENRQHIGLHMRTWNKDWRICVLLAMLQEIMKGHGFSQVALEYQQFLEYIVENGLEDVCDLRPIVNGDEIMKALDTKKGPWMSKAVSMVVEWQLLHPEIADKAQALEAISSRRAELGFILAFRNTSQYLMDKLRTEAREALHRRPLEPPPTLLAAFDATEDSLTPLWQDIASHESNSHLGACENLAIAINYIEFWDPLLPNDEGPKQLAADEIEAVIHLSAWASRLALPSSEFAISFDETAEISDSRVYSRPPHMKNDPVLTVTTEDRKAQDEGRLRVQLAITVLILLHKKHGGRPDRSVFNSPDLIVAMASFTSEHDPWTNEESRVEASMLRDATILFPTGDPRFWSLIERVLKEKIRPLFTRTRNPAITSEGRKNFHPVPLTRFYGSSLDAEASPWKTTDVYAPTVLAWIISQYRYQPADKAYLEAHFPLLVPAILALIDDSSIAIKTRGCTLLTQLLQPIRKSGSDILRRTNLVSVFEDALTPCLLSLPTITPEESSLKLLGAAYPALLSLFQTAYHAPPFKQADKEKNLETYLASLTKVLRSNLISSFHHVSSSTPAAISTSASFPHPRLSTFLVEWIATFVHELGIHSTKYLQDLIPVLYTTLSNPFANAHPPLLLTAATTTRTVVLNAHPRVWRWRGEIFGGLSASWLHAIEEEKEKEKNKQDKETLANLKRELQGTAAILKYALLSPVPVEGEVDADRLQVKEGLQQELQKLVDADPALKDLFGAEVQAGKGVTFANP
ncbi:Protein of unknown function DUF2454 [Penicillium alfredii]|uniref:Poly A polymerase head domain-containing protein n=1 Tax=Penicillium alfredii TaxID=1506179 RepID=A0A9W9FL02_9EURO|nr:Protein of unknown function DUF2454 [Penicillium alfredii]KAJ5102156.1 Protein of unknown function DUF2454 [Penicillium alfredii]